MLDLLILINILVILLVPYLTIVLLMFTLGRTVKSKKDFNRKHTVTIFLPTYNEENLIEKKLDNLLEQACHIHEILIYDCSTDKTPVIIQEYQKKIPQSSSSGSLAE
jgi:cellulose synthase/poly-beta-1,6-N-acetylglucosamine synthase-like glycosyltransferase